MLKRFCSYYKPNLKLFIFDMCCALIVAGCDMLLPVVSGNIVDEYIPSNNIRLLLIWCGVLVCIYVLKMVLNYCIQYYGHIVGVRMQYQMRNEIFMHLQKLPFSYFDNNKTGSIMSRIINDLMDVSELAHHGPEDLFLSLILLIGAFILMAKVNIWLTLIIFCAIPFLVWFSMKKRIKLGKAFTEMRVQVAEVNANLENSISGIRVSKSFENSEYELEHFEDNNKKYLTARGKSYKVMAEFFAGNNFIIDILNVISIISSGFFAIKGYITPGEFTLFIMFVAVFMTPVKRLVNFIEQLQSGMTGFKRFTEIMDVEPEADEPDAQELKDVRGDIKFTDVSFEYENGKQVLNDINLHIPFGKTVAFVGPSGGGKTTICNLIPRFYEISAGVIEIDGKDIKTLTRASIRENIGMVSQDVFLFTGTIYDNILYGKPGASREEVLEAAKKARIDDFVGSLPDGYDTYIGERGVKLSGGQKQRVAIARVFLKNPPILILDEATSALDNATEIMIQEALRELSIGRTTLIVAHRLTTIRDADEIIVIGEDGIEERGTHESLLSQNGIYAGLYNSQFRE